MLFIDPVCPKPYSPASLGGEIMGGTEATVIRLLGALPDAEVMQHNRGSAAMDDGRYRPLDWGALPREGPIVVLRNSHYALHLRQIGWRGPLYLWLHDLAELNLALTMPALVKAEIELIAVSRWHRDQVLGVTRAVFDGDAPPLKVHVIYNPVQAGLQPSGMEPDPNRMVFLSTPHKGLRGTLKLFQLLKARHPALELIVAHDGGGDIRQPGVIPVKGMTHAEAMALLAGAFCMFYPNLTYPETFGIVYAEANTLGTPVIAHDFGAAAEVLDDPRQLVNGYDEAEVIDRYERWRDQGRPKVAGRDLFQLPSVLAQWRALGV